MHANAFMLSSIPWSSGSFASAGSCLLIELFLKVRPRHRGLQFWHLQAIDLLYCRVNHSSPPYTLTCNIRHKWFIRNVLVSDVVLYNIFANRSDTGSRWLSAPEMFVRISFIKFGISLNTFEAECDFRICSTRCIKRFLGTFISICACAKSSPKENSFIRILNCTSTSRNSSATVFCVFGFLNTLNRYFDTSTMC